MFLSMSFKYVFEYEFLSIATEYLWVRLIAISLHVTILGKLLSHTQVLQLLSSIIW